MISPRTIWRVLVLPTYILITGVVFALALRNTAGSILSPLASLAPWVVALASGLAMLSIAGAVLRWRRRLAAVRRVRAAQTRTAPSADWHEDETGRVEPHAAPR